MSKVTASTDIAQVKPEEVPRFTEIALQDIVKTINGGLDFGANFSCKVLSVSFAAALTQQAITHDLGRVPTGYIMTGQSVPVAVYTGSNAWTTSVIYLTASAISTVGFVIF